MRREKARFIVMQDDAEKDAEVELSLCLSIGGGSSRMTPKPSSVSCELQEEENGESAREFSVSGRGILDFELLSGAVGSSCADLDDSAAPFCPNFLNPTLRPYPEMEMRGIQFVNEFGFPCLMMPWWAPAVPMASGNIRPLRSPASPGSGIAVDVGRGSFSDISDQASSSLQGAEPKDEFPGSGKSSSGGDESGNSKRRRRWMSTCTMKRPPPAGTADGRSLSGGAPAALPRLPCVSTTGKGPKGKTITGLLYRYTAAEVSIVCVCHGSFFSPAEFVKHAGGTDVDAANPLRHITVVPF